MQFIRRLAIAGLATTQIFLAAACQAKLPSGGQYVLPPPDQPAEISANTKILKQMSRELGAVAEASKKALVFVSVAKTIRGYGQMDPFDYLFGFGARQLPAPRQEGLGSGFFIDLDRGYILTNNHVIEGADEINLKLASGKSYDAKVIGSESDMDIAVVQIKDPDFARSGLSSLVLGDSDQLKVGSFVVALGAPFGLEASISFGVVSALGRGSLSITQIGDFIQTDAAINPGNSGGPLIDMDGRVAGINTAIFSKSGGYNGIGFTVPSNLVRRVASDLINGTKVSRGYIGVYFQKLTDDFVKWLQLPDGTTGVIVTQVEPGGPAHKAGIRPKDVIIAIDGKALDGDRDLVSRIGIMKPGRKADLTIIRNGKKEFKTLVLGLHPGAGGGLAEHGQSVRDTSLGLELRWREDGLYVARVEQRSPAAGILRSQDLILSVERYDFDKAKSQEDALKNFNNAVAEARKKKQDSVVMRIKRGDRFGFVTIDIN